jgi:hypothetical protein
VLIMRIFGRVLRWVLSGYCVACNRKISDLDPGCIECDHLARAGAADVLNQEELQRWRADGRDMSAGLAVGQSSWAQAAWRESLRETWQFRAAVPVCRTQEPNAPM